MRCFTRFAIAFAAMYGTFYELPFKFQSSVLQKERSLKPRPLRYRCIALLGSELVNLRIPIILEEEKRWNDEFHRFHFRLKISITNTESVNKLENVQWWSEKYQSYIIISKIMSCRWQGRLITVTLDRIYPFLYGLRYDLINWPELSMLSMLSDHQSIIEAKNVLRTCKEKNIKRKPRIERRTKAIT